MLSPRAALAQAPASASGDAVVVAEKYASDAFEAYERRDYARAIVLYEQALATTPSADILYNIARVYDLGLRDRRLAMEYYQRYADDPGAVPERIAAAQKRIEALRAAELASAEAREAPPRSASVRQTEAPAAEPDSGGLSGLRVAAIGAGSAGLVGIGLGVGFGLSARAQTDTWQRDCDGNACTSQRGLDAAETAAQRANIATVGFAAGGGLLALGAVLWWLGGDDDERPGDTARLRVTPTVTEGGAGGVVTGRF